MNNKEIAISISLEQVCNDLLSNCNLISKNMLDEALVDLRADVMSPDSDETKSLICRAITESWGNVKYQANRYLTTGRSVDDNTLERIASPGDAIIYWGIIDSSLSNTNAYTQFGTLVPKTVEYSAPTVNVHGASGKDIIIAVEAGAQFDVYDVEGNAIVVDGVSKNDDCLLYQSALKHNGVYYDEFRFSGWQQLAVTLDNSAFPQKYEVLKIVLSIPNFNLGVTDALKSAIHKYMVDYTTCRFLKDLQPEKATEYKDTVAADQEVVRRCLNARERLNMRRASWL